MAKKHWSDGPGGSFARKKRQAHSVVIGFCWYTPETYERVKANAQINAESRASFASAKVMEQSRQQEGKGS